MKRTPLLRRTPLRSRPASSGPAVRPAAPPLDLDAARRALQRQADSAAADSRYAGVPLAAEINRSPNKSDGSFSPVVRQTIIDRDHGLCQRCGGPYGSIQHRIARMMGGTNAPHISRAANGVALCGTGTTGCHGIIEAHPVLAQETGFAAASWADPSSVPYLRYDGTWVLLTDNGNAHRFDMPPGMTALNIAVRRIG